MRTIHQPRKPGCLIAGQPGVHCLPRHRPLPRDLSHRAPVGQNREHRLIPLLNHRNLPHGEGVSRISRRRCVNHRPKLCNASTEAELSSISRITTGLLHRMGGAAGARTQDRRIMRGLKAISRDDEWCQSGPIFLAA